MGEPLNGMKQIAARVGLSESTVLQLIRYCKLPARKVRDRGIWISDTDAVDDWRKKYAKGEIKKAVKRKDR